MRNLFLLGALAAVALPALAADHAEAPGTEADAAADIADFYAWEDGDHIVAIVTFAGLTAAGGDATYDADVLYGIHIDTDGDNMADHDIWARFGEATASTTWGVQFSGIPGGDAVVEGPVATDLDAGNGLMARAGLHDDPFFFDFAGFGDTLATGTIAFDSSRDSFAGTNVTALVVTMDKATLGVDDTNIGLWATTGRK